MSPMKLPMSAKRNLLLVLLLSFFSLTLHDFVISDHLKNETVMTKEFAVADDLHEAIHTLVAINDTSAFVIELPSYFLVPSAPLPAMASSHPCVLERPPLS